MKAAPQKTKSEPAAVNEMAYRFDGGAGKESGVDVAQTSRRYAPTCFSPLCARQQ